MTSSEAGRPGETASARRAVAAASTFWKLTALAELLRRGYSDEDIIKIAGRNHLRAMREIERVAAELQRSEPPLTAELPAGDEAP
jgi:hypothetical protein